MLKFKKGGYKMEKKKTVFANVIKKIAEKSLKRDSNNTTCVSIYQPKAPVELKKFCKSNKE